MASSRSKRKRGSDQLTECPSCSIEFSQATPPVALPCGHHLCKACLEQNRRRRGIVRCPVDGIEKKVLTSHINVDFLDFVELLKAEHVEVPHTRRGVSDQATQCDIMKPEVNYGEVLAELYKKEQRLQRELKYCEELYKQAEIRTQYYMQYIPVYSWPYVFK